MKKITDQCLLLGLLILVLALFWWYKKSIIIEGNFVDDVNAALNYKPGQEQPQSFESDMETVTDNNIEESIYDAIDTAGGGINSVLSDIADFVIEKEVDTTPKWRDLKSTQITSTPDFVTIPTRPDTSFIITDNCSSKSMFNSEYKDDICSVHIGDYQTIDQKCKAMSNENCNLISCCVLLNGNKCVAGNINGPTYLTDQGNEIDYKYYKYRGKIYPENYNFNPTGDYLKNCGKYASNSTNVSKACMLQMFNDAGCTNTKPDSIINNASVYKYSKSSKRYIQSDLENAVKLLQSKIRNKDDDARILCHGRDPNKICDNFKNDSLAVSKECMIEMFNDAGCPNKLPSNTIDDTFVLNNSTLTKNRLKTYMNFFTEKIKTLADNKDDIGSDINLANRIICYGHT